MAVTFSVKSQDGRLISNLSVAEVKRLFDEGKINDHDMISKDGTDQWHPARKYKGASSKNNSSQSQQPSRLLLFLLCQSQKTIFRRSKSLLPTILRNVSQRKNLLLCCLA